MAEQGFPIVDRDPEWRMVWDEVDPPLRKHIGRSVRRGEAMQEPALAAIAVAAALRWKRQLTIQAILFSALGSLMVLWLLGVKSPDPPVAYWIAVATALVWMVVAPLAAFSWRRRATAAEAANREVVEAGPA